MRCLSCLYWYQVCSVIAGNGIADHRDEFCYYVPQKEEKEGGSSLGYETKKVHIVSFYFTVL